MQGAMYYYYVLFPQKFSHITTFLSSGKISPTSSQGKEKLFPKKISLTSPRFPRGKLYSSNFFPQEPVQSQQENQNKINPYIKTRRFITIPSFL
jgi:hypothetical protein